LTGINLYRMGTTPDKAGMRSALLRHLSLYSFFAKMLT
jgi:hypothetical protein